ncbi:MAG: glycosyltransferase 87 family protein [Candidatus Micrarchaeota archaeon]
MPVILSIALAILWVFLSYSLGKKLVGGLRMGGAKEFAFATAAGFMLFSAALFALASLQALHSAGVWLLLALAAVLCIRDLKKNADAIFSLLKQGEQTALSFMERPWSAATALLIALILAIQLASALAPPSSNPTGPMDWDSLVYHFAVPKAYLAHGGFESIAGNPYSNWPLAADMLHAGAMAVGSVELARVLSLCLAGVFLLALYAYSREFLGKAHSLAAAAVFLSMPAVQSFLGTGYIDLTLALYSLLAFWALCEWHDGRGGKLLWLAACFSGFAAAIKLTGLMIVAIIGLGAAYSLASKKEWKRMRKFAFTLALFAVVCGVWFAPYYLKTWHYTGNPAWPYRVPFLESVGITGEANAYYAGSLDSGMRTSGVSHDPLLMPLVPLFLTFLPKAYNGIITPLFLAFIPVLFLYRKEKWPKQIRRSLLFATSIVLLWYAGWQDVRFLMPAFAVLAPVSGFALGRIPEDGLLRKAALAALVVVLAGAAAYGAAYKSASFAAGLGLESSENYLLRTEPAYGTMAWGNANLPADAKVFLSGETHAFYLDREYAYSALYDFGAYGDAGTLRAQLRHEGFTHVLVNANNPRAAAEERKVSELLINHGRLLYSCNDVLLYGLE